MGIKGIIDQKKRRKRKKKKTQKNWQQYAMAKQQETIGQQETTGQG